MNQRTKNTFQIISALVGFIVVLCGGCKEIEKAHQTSEVENAHLEFERMIDSLGIRKAYEDTRWIFYCIYCDDSAKVYVNADSFVQYNATFGQLPLRISLVSLARHDTIGVVFAFYYNDTVELDLTYIQPGGVAAAGYKQGMDTLLYLMSFGGAISNVSCDSTQFSKEDCPIREVNPLQPEVIRYIKENRSSLDPWFREEAIRRGVIPKQI